MKKIIIWVAFLATLFSASILFADIPIESLDYAQLMKSVPEGWIIKNVSVADSPHEWSKTKGGRGITVTLQNPTQTVHDSMVGETGLTL